MSALAQLHRRAEWGARPPKRPLVPFRAQVLGLSVHWSGTPVPRLPTPDLLRGVQDFHQGPQRNWRDIAYNLGIAEDGVWEARGLDFQNGAHDDDEPNERWIAAEVLIGKGQRLTPALLANITLARQMVVERHGPAAVGLAPHSRWTATECPGDEIRGLIAAGGIPLHITGPGPEEDDDMPFTKDELEDIVRSVVDPAKEAIVNEGREDARQVKLHVEKAVTVTVQATVAELVRRIPGAGTVDVDELVATVKASIADDLTN